MHGGGLPYHNAVLFISDTHGVQRYRLPNRHSLPAAANAHYQTDLNRSKSLEDHGYRKFAAFPPNYTRGAAGC
jgi:hypothetical protein